MSDWWPKGLCDDGHDDIKNTKAKEQTKIWKQMVKDALADGWEPPLRRRRSAAIQLAAMATEQWLHKEQADKKRSVSHNVQRAAAGGSAVLAAGSGGALAAGLSGLPAKIFGITIIALAIATGAGSAVWPETEYERQRTKSRQYEQLWRDIWAYATLTLPTSSPDSIAADLKQFSARIEAVGSP